MREDNSTRPAKPDPVALPKLLTAKELEAVRWTLILIRLIERNTADQLRVSLTRPRIQRLARELAILAKIEGWIRATLHTRSRSTWTVAYDLIVEYQTRFQGLDKGKKPE